MNHTSDITPANFENEVLQTSYEKLVLLDLWAPWCAPCRQLKPLLEKLAEDYEGDIHLAKLNTEEHPELAQQLQVRGIPDVRFVYQGEIVDQFTGVLPESEIKKKISAFVKDSYQSFLENLPPGSSHVEAFAEHFDEYCTDDRFLVDYAKELVKARQFKKALKVIASIEPTSDLYEPAQGIKVMSQFLQKAETLGETEIEQHFKKSAQEYEQHHLESAIESLLWVLEKDKSYQKDLARKVMIQLLNECTDPEALRRYRRQFSMIIRA